MGVHLWFFVPNRLEIKHMLNVQDSFYLKWISEIKADYRRSQIKAAVKVNEELLRFYWRLGRGIARLRSEAR